MKVFLVWNRVHERNVCYRTRIIVSGLRVGMEEIELLVDGVHAEPAQLDGEVGGDEVPLWRLSMSSTGEQAGQQVRLQLLQAERVLHKGSGTNM